MSIEHAKRSFREEGTIPLVKKAIRYARTKQLKYIDNPLWRRRGGVQQLSIGQTTARFEAHPDYGGDMIRWLAVNEGHIASDLLRHLKPGDVVLDVGANIGYYTCFCANHRHTDRVVAVEPHPANANQLRRNLAHNRAEIVDIEQVALGPEHDEVQFSGGDAMTQTAAIADGSGGVTVEQVRGDECLDSAPDVVKIDVEGSEPVVIDGLSELLSSSCRLLFCEVHLPAPHRPSIADYGVDLDQMRQVITDLGFDIVSESLRGDEVHIKARPR